MNSDYVARALCFHGPPMQKIWLDERGESDLQKMGLQQPNFNIYQERQRYFTFQDRAKRLKLHQFITRKASDLYPNDLRPRGTAIRDEHIERAKKNVAIVPPYEVFVKWQDKAKRRQIALAELKEGDIIYGDIKDKSLKMLTIRPLCTAEPLVRFMADLNIKAMVNHPNFVSSITAAGVNKGSAYNTNDYVCCEVHSVSLDAGRINLTLIAGPNSNQNVQLGVVQYEELPAYYRQVTERTGSYMECLLQAPGFENPNYDDLFSINGLNVNDTYSLIGSLKFEFPRDEYAKELRQTQAGKWAIRSVAEGIERFKQGQHLEAFQYLNKALNIDPHNVEGLVARGALYANKGSFLKAVADFEKALKLNVYHGNARKYLSETLVALGRSYEEEERLEDAAKAYKDCLNIMPKHEQALFCLNAVNMRLCNAGLQPYIDNTLPLPTQPLVPAHMQQQMHMLPTPAPHMHQQMAMENSTVSVSSSNEDDSSDDDSSSNSDSAHRSKSRLSPLSQRLAMQNQMSDLAPPPPEYNRPFFATENSSSGHRFHQNSVLDEDDTDKRVRRLLEAASKHKKEKKKKKKAKKSKKSSSKDSAAMAAQELLKNIDFKEAFKAIGGIQFEHKITENLQLYEQTINEIRRRQEQQKERDGSETPPPPPSMTLPSDDQPSTSKAAAGIYKNSTISFGISGAGTSSLLQTKKPSLPMASSSSMPPQKLSFQIKRPVKMDKFGLMRIATPLTSPKRSRSPSNSLKRNNSPRQRASRSRSRSIDRERGSRRSRERSRDRAVRSRRSRSRSRSRRRRRSRSRSRTRSSRKRSRSLTRRRRSRSRSKSNERRGSWRRSPASRRRRSGSESSDRGIRVTRARVTDTKRPPPRTWCPPNFRDSARNNSRWQHDKFRVDSDDGGGDVASNAASKIDDGPSIEEIDEIIKEAQNKRKQSIINNNKDILKKPFA